jgi:hypothetical protein
MALDPILLSIDGENGADVAESQGLTRLFAETQALDANLQQAIALV